MLKSFKELYDLDLSKYSNGKRDYISKKPVFKYDKAQGKAVETDVTLDYLNWADCLTILYSEGAQKIVYDTIKNENGHSLFLCLNNLPEIRVFVEIDEDRRELTYPIIDGTKDISMEKITQSDIHNATQRAFVKCVAVNWGLGLSLWQKEEKLLPELPKEEDISIHNIMRIKKRIENLITVKLQNGLDVKDLYANLDINEKQFNTIMKYFDTIFKFEEAIKKL
jgi:hypothetical protein